MGQRSKDSETQPERFVLSESSVMTKAYKFPLLRKIPQPRPLSLMDCQSQGKKVTNCQFQFYPTVLFQLLEHHAMEISLRKLSVTDEMAAACRNVHWPELPNNSLHFSFSTLIAEMYYGECSLLVEMHKMTLVNVQKPSCSQLSVLPSKKRKWFLSLGRARL